MKDSDKVEQNDTNEGTAKKCEATKTTVKTTKKRKRHLVCIWICGCIKIKLFLANISMTIDQFHARP